MTGTGIVPAGGQLYKIVNRNSGKVLDINGFSHRRGTSIQRHSFAGGNNQLWPFQPTTGGYLICNWTHQWHGRRRLGLHHQRRPCPAGGLGRQRHAAATTAVWPAATLSARTLEQLPRKFRRGRRTLIRTDFTGVPRSSSTRACMEL
ncbi:RICIN domain-containing protein [Streptomyces sp. NPDC020794]|uniref:RICIN domain-containing protein n=1 Tax=unclassified Streptomyces TaxID=2593676 RepID=UPI000BE22861|nr:RICIN domain-containing protein [Streptomyces sp. Ag109_G2-15]